MSAKSAGFGLGKFFEKRKPVDFWKDILGGVIVALVSVPISMGYAQIAGLPMQYGLYGSVIPIFLFGLLTSSRDFVFGVDAAPAALVGTTIASLGISYGSEEAMNIVPLIAFFVACWLLLFFVIKAGKVVQYISEPVMGGFVSGICCTIILMQVPKLFGGSAGVGEAPELIRHLIGQLDHFHWLSFSMGMAVIVGITVCRHLVPKIPMSVVMMAVGILVNVIFQIGQYGVAILPEVENGFPGFRLPSMNFDYDMAIEMVFDALSIAAVILSESLLASKGNAGKDGYRLNANREILAYAAANFASALTGCCPVNGSVSRTGIVRQFGAGSQWLSVSASVTMLLLLLFGAKVIGWMPVPVLTAIVISALMGACEFGIAKRLFRSSKQEFVIFCAAFLGVLIFGTVYGVLIGVGLSFVAVIVKAVAPPRTFLGVIPGKDGFYSLERNSEARPVRNTVIYRFGGNLFFANIDPFCQDIEQALQENTKVVIVSAGAVGSIDTAAAEGLLHLHRRLQEKQIRFYLTEHVGELNDQLRRFGAEELIRNGAVRMTVPLALRDAGIKKPYPLEQSDVSSEKPEVKKRELSVFRVQSGIQAELEWAFGSGAEEFKNELTEEIYQSIKKDDRLRVETVEKIEGMSRWGRLSLVDEEELLDRLETRLLNRALRHPEKAEHIELVLEERRRLIEKKLMEMDQRAFEKVRQKRLAYARKLYERDPENFALIRRQRKKHLSQLEQQNPSLAEKYREVYGDLLTWEPQNSQDEKSPVSNGSEGKSAEL